MVWAASLVLLAGGCRSGDDGADAGEAPSPASPPGSEAGPTSEDGGADADIVRSYVEAMNDGDIDLAMELRCRAGRPSPDERELFEADLQRLLDTTGELGVGRIEVSDTDPRVEASLQGRHAVELTYWMTTDGEEVDDPLLGIVVDEDGKRRICTFTTGAFPLMDAELGDELADVGQPSTGDLADLLPSTPGPDYHTVMDERMDLSTLSDELDAATEGWARSWQEETYGGVTVSALRFAGAGDALDAGRAWMARVDAPAVEIFDVPDVPGASGVRFLGYEWLWLQPPTSGPYVDEVSMVLGDTYVTIGVGAVPTGEGHDIAVAQAQEVARRARA